MRDGDASQRSFLSLSQKMTKASSLIANGANRVMPCAPSDWLSLSV